MVDLSVLGIVVREESNTPYLLLHPHGTRQVVSLRISSVEAFAVSMVLNGDGGAAGYPAPSSGVNNPLLSPHSGLPHDLIARLAEMLGGRLLAVELLEIAEKGCFAEIVLKSHSGIARLKCRPVDTIILALRCGVLIRMPRHLLPLAEDMDAVVNSLPKHVRAGIAAKVASPLEAGRDGTEPDVSPTDEAATANETSLLSTDPRQQIITAARKILDQHGLSENLEKILAPARKTPSAQSGPAHTLRLPKVETKLVSVSKSDPLSGNSPEARDTTTGGISEAAAGGLNRRPETGSPDRSKTQQNGVSREDKDPKSPRIRVSLVRQPADGVAEIVDEFHFSAGSIPREVLASLGLTSSEADALNKEDTDDDRWATLLRILAPETKVLM